MNKKKFGINIGVYNREQLILTKQIIFPQNKIYGNISFFMKIIMVKGYFFAIKKFIIKDHPFIMKYNFW